MTSPSISIHRKLSEIRQLGRRAIRGFDRLGLEQRREVVERLDTVTAERLAATITAVTFQRQTGLLPGFKDQPHD